MMDHSNIARSKRRATDWPPYFVMELVRASHHRLLRRERLRPERLELFVQVCQAIQHAHQRIIHRDLKPSNVWLASTMEAGAQSDRFGVAKAAGPKLTEATLFTGSAPLSARRST
jgi:non-specific serine/threonine protein kinase/serine/threonine-protein kinase